MAAVATNGPDALMNKNHMAGRFALSAAGLTAALVVFALPASAITIDVTYQSGTYAVPVAMQAAFNAVVSQFDSAITNNATVYINVGYGAVNTTPLVAGQVGTVTAQPYTIGSYSALKTDLQSQYGITGFSAVLPASTPVGSASFYAPAAEAKALAASGVAFTTTSFYTGATGANPGYDAYIGFSSTLAFDYSDASGTTTGQYDFIAVAKHELEEALGRKSGLDNGGTTSSFIAMPMDAFRYSSAGVTSYTLTPSTPAYFSVNGGVTNSGTFADQYHNGGDPGDWQSPINSPSTDAQSAVLSAGKTYGLSLQDATALQALGYSVAANNGNGLFSASNQPIGAPEPASLAVLGTGIVVLGRIRRRR
jgi:hypothetical protein